MSFMRKMTDMLKSGKVPDLKAVTQAAKSSLGNTKSDSPFARREITDDMLSPAQLQVSRMAWDWREATQSSNKGSGQAVRNWDQPSAGRSEDLYLSWQPPAAAVKEYVTIIAWRGWATALVMRDSERFEPTYIDALLGDRLATIRVLRFPANNAPHHNVRFAAGDENDFYYLKLIAQTESGEYVEVKDYSVASNDKRATLGLPALTPDDALTLTVPAGSREPNPAEAAFKPKL